MFFCTNHKLKDVNVDMMNFDGSEIKIVDSYKYLGVMLDSKLKFDKHVNYMYSKIYPKLKTIRRIRCYIGKRTAIYLYNSLINPLFSFSDVVYDTMSQLDTNKLQVLQNNCVRVCLKCDKTTPHTEMYNTSGIKPLHEQCKEHTALVVYKGLNQESTGYINNMFTRNMDKSTYQIGNTWRHTYSMQ